VSFGWISTDIYIHRCKKCKGEKTVKEKKAVDVLVERGMSHNQKIVMKGEADQQVCRLIFYS
jgi:DnaJ-class molecular chaperone